MYKSETVPYKATKELPPGKTLVFAPHPDDEVFGCGGAIIKHVQQNDAVKVVIVTDGSFPVNETQNHPGYIEIRKKESRAAAKILGYGDPEFLNYPDGFLVASEELINHLLKVIEQFQPQHIYLPSNTEIHPDHQALSTAGIRAAITYKANINLYFYEIGQALKPTVFLDITNLQPKLEKAMDCFQSQLEVQDYKRHITALHAFRTYTLGQAVKFAEAYNVVSSSDLKPGDIRWNQDYTQLQKTPLKKHSAKNHPLISVIVRTMNRPELPEALESIANQAYPNLEIIIVDAKGDEDLNLGAFCGNHPIRIISKNKALNRPQAANAGLEAVKGEYFCFLDEDDLIYPEHINLLFDTLKQGRNIAVYSGIKVQNLITNTEFEYNSDFSINKLHYQNFIPIHALLFSSTLIVRGCRFDESFEIYEDWDFLLQISKAGSFEHINKISGIYRLLNSSGVYYNQEKKKKFRLKLIDKWILKLSAGELLMFMEDLTDHVHSEKVNPEKQKALHSPSYGLSTPIKLRHPSHLKIKYLVFKNKMKIRNSGLFNAGYYLQQNPDVASTGLSAAGHYLLYGGFEGRNPSKYFNSAFYLMDNPDVAKAGINPLIHYLGYGKAEGRRPLPETSSTSDNPLKNYFYSNQKNIIHKWVHYFDVYHSHFRRFVGTECVILEIGVSMGGSLQMWKEYFGSKAKIYGIDIQQACKGFEEKNIEIFIGSQSDRDFLKKVKEEIPPIDILIDDGGHTMKQQITTFEELYGHIKGEGIYICEDLHTSYWEEFGGGLNRPGTFIEYSKHFIDKLNAWHSREDDFPVSDFTKSTNAIHFYDSMLVIEKKKRDRPYDKKTGSLISTLKNRKHLIDFTHIKLQLLGVTDKKVLQELSENRAALPSYLGVRYDGKNWPETGETMIGYKRLTNLEDCIKNIVLEKIPGDLIETGVWRGGACIFMRSVLKELNVTDRIVWLADSFEGLPPPDPSSYPEDAGDNLHTFKELAISENEVRNNFKKYKLLDNQVRFLKGWFKDTMPTASIEKLSILRLDGDMYESTIDVLFYLYPKLSVGGYCIIDDWGAIPACKKAVEDYRRVHAIDEKIQIIDWSGVFWKKEKETPRLSLDIFKRISSQRVQHQSRTSLIQEEKTEQNDF